MAPGGGNKNQADALSNQKKEERGCGGAERLRFLLVIVCTYHLTLKLLAQGSGGQSEGFMKCLKCNISSVVGKYAEHCNLLFLQSSDRLTEGFLGFSLKCVASNWISEHTEF